MEEDIAGHGLRPLMQKAQEEGIYASFMPTDLIVTRLDQGLTLPPRIHPKTLADIGEPHKESTSKEHATKDSTSEAHDRHLKDDLSQENASNDVDCTNETQQEHTGKIYNSCQHIDPTLHHRQEKLTDGPPGFSFPGQKQLAFCSSSQAPHLASGRRLAKIQSAGCQGSIVERSDNQLQLARINGNILSICPMGDRAVSGSSRPQDIVPQTKRPKSSDVGILCNRECTAVIEQPVPPNHLISQQTDDLHRGIGDRGQEPTLSLGSKVELPPGSELSQESTLSMGSMVEALLGPKLSQEATSSLGSTVEGFSGAELSQEVTLSLGSMVEGLVASELTEEATLSLGSMVKSFSGSELTCASLKGVVNKGDGKATGNMSAPEQQQDEKSQDEKLQYEEPQDKIHTSGQVSVYLVEQETEAAGGVSCGVESPKAEGVEASLYSPVYKSPKANASSQVNTTIPTTIRNRLSSKHTQATLQHGSLSTLYSSQAQLLSLRNYIATAPLPSPGVRKIQQVILAAMDGEIEVEGNPALDAQLDAICDRMSVDEQFQGAVLSFIASKLGYHVTEDDAGSSDQSSPLGANTTASNTTASNTTASNTPDLKFNTETCTLEELKEQYNATKALAIREHNLRMKFTVKCSSLEKNAKALKEECDHWKTISSSVPGSKAVKNQSAKWECKSCHLLNDSWAYPTDWDPRKAPKKLKPGPEEAGVPVKNKDTWVQTEYCRHCGRHKFGGRSEQKPESPSKRKLAHVIESERIASDAEFKRRCKEVEAGLNTGDAAPTQFERGDSPAAAPVAQSPQVPFANQYMGNMQQVQVNGSNSSTRPLPNVSGTVADQHWLPNSNSTAVTNQQFSPKGNGTLPSQQFSPNGTGTVPRPQFPPYGNGRVPKQQFSPNANGTVPSQQFSPNSNSTIPENQNFYTRNSTIGEEQSLKGNGTVPNQPFSPKGNGTVPNQQSSPNTNCTIPGQHNFYSGNGTIGEQQSPLKGGGNGIVLKQQFSPNTNGTIREQQNFYTGNGTIGEHQSSPIVNGTTGGQKYSPAGNNMVADQQYSPNGNSNTSDQQYSHSLTGTNADQHSLPNTSGLIASEQCLPSTSGSNTDQPFVPDVMGLFTYKFPGDDELFANFNWDAIGDESQDQFQLADWFDGKSSLNTDFAMSATLQTPTALSPAQPTLPSTFPTPTALSPAQPTPPSTFPTPSSTGFSKETPIEIEDDDFFPNSQAYYKDIIESFTANALAITAPAKPQSNPSKHAKPSVKYDIRGNKIAPSPSLPTARYPKAMAPRTARLGALTFPTIAAPENAAPQAAQHPYGG
ncbi:hypothetical protein VE03_04652 [Pseudogymnoascus sp. 23342-1-I1]|nr:hypothetical protein VE03_04652 [Pseudogymnoascus sp. 23342-1-I1]